MLHIFCSLLLYAVIPHLSATYTYMLNVLFTMYFSVIDFFPPEQHLNRDRIVVYIRTSHYLKDKHRHLVPVKKLETNFILYADFL